MCVFSVSQSACDLCRRNARIDTPTQRDRHQIKEVDSILPLGSGTSPGNYEEQEQLSLNSVEKMKITQKSHVKDEVKEVKPKTGRVRT